MNKKIILATIAIIAITFSLVEMQFSEVVASSTIYDYVDITFYYQNGNQFSTKVGVNSTLASPQDNVTYFGSLPLEFTARWNPAFPANIALGYFIDGNQTLGESNIANGSGFHGGPPYEVTTTVNMDVDISALESSEHKITIYAQLTVPDHYSGKHTFAPIFFYVFNSSQTPAPTPTHSPSSTNPVVETSPTSPILPPSPTPSSTIEPTLTPSPTLSVADSQSGDFTLPIVLATVVVATVVVGVTLVYFWKRQGRLRSKCPA